MLNITNQIISYPLADSQSKAKRPGLFVLLWIMQ